MNLSVASTKLLKFGRLFRLRFIAFLTITSFLFIPLPVKAHHPLGGGTPTNFFEGFMSGIGHPVIGVDHLVFVISVGLLAAITHQGIKIPLAFAFAAMAGTGLHLMEIDLPAPELIISGSVLLFGVFLALKNRPHSLVLTGLAAIMGLFHGYAYGEAIFGAEITPLVAYLAGFTAIQLIIATAAFFVGKTLMQQASEQPNLPFRFAGFTICGVGAAFLSTLILETIFPV